MHAQLTAARQEGEAVQRRAAAAERAELAQQHHQELHAVQLSHEQVQFMHPRVRQSSHQVCKQPLHAALAVKELHDQVQQPSSSSHLLRSGAVSLGMRLSDQSIT